MDKFVVKAIKRPQLEDEVTASVNIVVRVHSWFIHFIVILSLVCSFLGVG